MNSNPYESPQAVENETPTERAPPHEKGCGCAIAFVFATIGGGLAGTVIGNLLAIAMGLLTLSTNPYGRRGNDSIFGINHPLSLVLLIVGSLSAAYAASRLANRRRTPREFRE